MNTMLASDVSCFGTASVWQQSCCRPKLLCLLLRSSVSRKLLPLGAAVLFRLRGHGDLVTVVCRFVVWPGLSLWLIQSVLFKICCLPWRRCLRSMIGEEPDRYVPCNGDAKSVLYYAKNVLNSRIGEKILLFYCFLRLPVYTMKRHANGRKPVVCYLYNTKIFNTLSGV